jgi:cell division protein FtsI (penicillin-binding protein 3)
MIVRPRIKVIGIFFIAFYGAVVGKAFYYQVIGDAEIQKFSASQYEKEIVIPPARGPILDRNGNKLAVTVTAYSIAASPVAIKDKIGFAGVAHRVLKVDKNKILKTLKAKKSFMYIKRQVERDIANTFVSELGKLEEFRREYKLFRKIGAVNIIAEPKRYYPGKELAANVIGFCDIDSVGLEGVEKTFDKYLKGKGMSLICEKDARGRLIIPEVIPDDEVLGHTLQLTLDKNIQFICEREIAEGVKKYRGKSGMAIAMSPITGEIYAMALYPAFDPNEPGKYGPWLRKNRAITDLYEPGSTFKAFLIAGALDSGIVKVTDRIYCENGVYRVQRRFIHDTHKSEWLTVPEVMKYSSNIGAVKIAEKLTPENFYDYILKFSFGSKTGIEMHGEASGILPSKKVFRKPIQYATTAFGQGIAATPLQVISAFCSIINGGISLNPYIVKEVRDRFGKIVYRGKPLYADRVLSSKTSAMMRDILKGVITEEGTGTLAGLHGYSVGGKTGTSQKVDFVKGGYSDERIASFIGFFPADEPSIVILVLIDEPQEEVYGGIVAAPIFNKIASKVAIYAGIAPDKYEDRTRSMGKVEKAKGLGRDIYPPDTFSVMKVSYTKDEEENFIMPDLEGLTAAQVLEMMEALPVEIRLNGSGIVVKQYPLPGKGMLPGKQCVITLGDE